MIKRVVQGTIVGGSGLLNDLGVQALGMSYLFGNK